MPELETEQSAELLTPVAEPMPEVSSPVLTPAVRAMAGAGGVASRFGVAALGSGVQEPPPETIASLLGRPEYALPANAPQKVRMLTDLQQRYGNAYMRRVMTLVLQEKMASRQESSALPSTPAPRPSGEKAAATPPRQPAPMPAPTPKPAPPMATGVVQRQVPVTMPVVVASPETIDKPGTAEVATASSSQPETAAPAQPMATGAVLPGQQPGAEAASAATQKAVVALPEGKPAEPAESPPTAISVQATSTSSKDDPEFQQTVAQLKYTKNVQKRHPKPEVKKQEVQNAARLPEDEQKDTNDRKAHLEAIDKTASQEKGAERFQAGTFKALLNQELAKLEGHLPQSEGAVKQFKQDKPLEQMRASISGRINEENQKVAAPIAGQTMLPRPPDSGIAAQPPGPLKKDVVGNYPKPIDPAAAAPKPKQDAEISMEEKSRSLDELMTENKLSDEQLVNSNEPDFLQALDSKQKAQAAAAAVPAQYRAQETTTLAEAQRGTGVSAQKALTGMVGQRSKNFGVVFGQQTSTQEADVSKQNVVQRELKRIYEATKKDVNNIFINLTTNEQSPTNVNKIFNEKSTAAKNTFEKRVEDQLDDIHGLGIKDFFFGKDTEAIEGVFVREKAKFLTAMDEVLHEIAGIIATQLNAAIKRIQQGRTEAETFFGSLSTEQQKLSKDAMEMFRAQYADLEASVDDKQAELVSSLVASYKENVDSLRATFDKLEEEASKNFLEKAADFVVGIAKAVYNLGKLLLSIVARIAGMIDEILAHPIRFLENLAAGIKQGFATFIGNFDAYLLKGFFDWLRGSVGSMGITLPERFDEKGLFGLATQLIGLNVQTFKEVVIRKLGAGGARIVAVLEKGEEILGEAAELFRILKTEGLGGVWTHLKEMIVSHLSEIFNRIKETVLYETIKKALIFIASLFTPVGAFIKAVQSLYAGLKFLMDNIERIAMLVNGFLDSLELAVKGDTGGIANKIITVLSTFIVVGIDFLAKLLNLGNLADKVRKIIQAFKAPVIRAMEWLVDKLIKPALEVAKKAGKAVKARVAKMFDWWQKSKEFDTAEGQHHKLFFTGRDENARLMISSKPKGVRDLIEERRNATTDRPTAQQLAALNHAEATVTAIENLTGMRKRERPQETESIATQLDPLLIQLAIHLATGGIDLAGLPLSRVTYRMNAGRAGTVTADPLTKNPGNTTGSPPSADIPAWRLMELIDWGVINPKRPDVEGPKFWVKMHLLSEQYHGPGVEWNLVAAPKTVNNGWVLTQVENPIKDYLSKGYKFKFTATVQYNHPAPAQDFPSWVEFTWEEMPPLKGPSQIKGQKGDNMPPPLIGGGEITKADLNTSSRRDLQIKGGVPQDLASAIVRERAKGGFTDLSQLKTRMAAFFTAQYAAEGAGPEFSYYLPKLRAVAGNLVFNGQPIGAGEF